jgi:hypothetical protein
MPTMQQVHLDAALSDFGYGVLQDSSEHVAGGFFPITEVDQLSNKYHVLPRNPFVRGDARLSTPLSEAPTFNFELSSDNYNCEIRRQGADVDQYKLQNADTVARRLYEEGATRIAVDNLLLTHEIEWAAKFFVAAVWGKTVTGVAAAPGANQFLQWNDANSDPEKDIDDGRVSVKLNGGLWPNRLLVGAEAWIALKRHPKIVDRVKHTSAEAITPAIVARLFGLERIVVAGAAKATNAVGQAEAYAFVHGKKALLAYCGENGVGDMMPSAGRVFAWRGLNPGAIASRILGVERLEMPLKKGVRYEAAMSWDNKMTGQQLGYFFETAVA